MRKRTFVLWKKILTRTLGLAIVIFTFYIYFKTNFFTIYTYEVTGAPEDRKSEIENKIKELSNTPIYKVIPTNKILTHRGSQIKSLVKELLPNTNEVDISVKPLHTLLIKITPYTATFKLDDRRAVTKDGYIYYESKDLESIPTIVVASSTISLEKKDGLMESKLLIDKATSTEILFDSIATIIPKINAVLFDVSKISVNPDGDIILSNNEGRSSVKLNSLVDMEKEWSNVISAIDTEPLKTLLETKKDSLEYIDVRFGNKVFYKFTKDGGAAIISDTNNNTNATSTSTETSR